MLILLIGADALILFPSMVSDERGYGRDGFDRNAATFVLGLCSARVAPHFVRKNRDDSGATRVGGTGVSSSLCLNISSISFVGVSFVDGRTQIKEETRKMQYAGGGTSFRRT